VGKNDINCGEANSTGMTPIDI